MYCSSSKTTHVHVHVGYSAFNVQVYKYNMGVVRRCGLLNIFMLVLISD